MTIFYEETNRESGYYKVDVLEAELSTNEEGKITLLLTIKVVSKETPTGSVARMSNWPDRTIFLPITENTMGTEDSPGWVRQLLLQLGLDLNTWQLGTLKQKGLAATCAHDDFTGTTKEKWSILGGKRRQGVSQDQIKMLQRKYGGKKKQAILPDNRVQKESSQKSSSFRGEDEIPF